MKFAVGYQLSDPDSRSGFVDLVRDYRGSVAEVYFPWVGAASGRAALGATRGVVDWDAQARLENDLRTLRGLGVKLDLLLNANCYGERAVSQHLESEVGSILTRLEDIVGGADIVTTASPFIARTVQEYFPAVDVRASVNMRIGTVQAMQYVEDLFDSFCLQRDVQRDIEYVQKVKAWCEEQDKGLCILANSGCLRNCPGQIFHDNMVAHETGIDEAKNVRGWTPHTCWRLYRDRANWPAILQATWIRPEDLGRYEGLCDVVKLATRMHEKPRLVIDAYAQGEYRGNLLDLFEPGFGPAFAPYIIDNAKFPDDWFEHISGCGGQCGECDYCARVLDDVLVETAD